MQGPPPSSTLPEGVWQTLRRLDPEAEEQVATLAACLALAEQRFQQLFRQVLMRFGDADKEDLGVEADLLADAHHVLTLLQDNLQLTSRRMLDVLDRVSRELGE